MKIMNKLLEKSIEEIHFQIAGVDKNIDLIEDKIKDVIEKERKEKKEKSLSEMNILSG